MRKLAILCLVVAALNAVIYYEPKTKEQKEGYKYGQTMRMLGFEKWECNKFKNIDEVKTEVDTPKAEEIIKTEPAPVFEQAQVSPQVSESVSTVEPVFAPEPSVPEEQKVTAAPIFGEPEVIKEAPINTVKNIKAMEVGVVIKGMNVTGDITSEGSLDVQGIVNGNISIEGRLEVTGEIN